MIYTGHFSMLAEEDPLRQLLCSLNGETRQINNKEVPTARTTDQLKQG